MSTSPAPLYSIRRNFWLFTLLTLAFIFVMLKLIQPLTSEAIVGFELAKTTCKAALILRDWDNHLLLGLFKRSVYLDFIFIFLYSVAFFFGCRFVSELSGHYILQKAGYGFSWLAPLAGVFDVLENIGMLKTVYSAEPSAWVVKFTYHMAVAKFSMLMIVCLFMIVCLIMWAIGKLIK
jgi:hypothetical protein